MVLKRSMSPDLVHPSGWARGLDSHLFDGYMKRVCLGSPSLDETSDEWLINHDVAYAVYNIKSHADHV